MRSLCRLRVIGGVNHYLSIPQGFGTRSGIACCHMLLLNSGSLPSSFCPEVAYSQNVTLLTFMVRALRGRHPCPYPGPKRPYCDSSFWDWAPKRFGCQCQFHIVTPVAFMLRRSALWVVTCLWRIKFGLQHVHSA